MTTTLFLQSEVQEPYKVYETMLCENPVFWDSTNNIWAIYSYGNCKAILSDPAALIPPANQNNKDDLNEYALGITDRLARTGFNTRFQEKLLCFCLKIYKPFHYLK
ncbi:MAG TPA: hypothetical protein VJU78_16420 [Chitinophagaceae bacterium]|nr:hypothetical protein [Chitinophagaceae bacterium]